MGWCSECRAPRSHNGIAHVALLICHSVTDLHALGVLPGRHRTPPKEAHSLCRGWPDDRRRSRLTMPRRVRRSGPTVTQRLHQPCWRLDLGSFWPLWRPEITKIWGEDRPPSVDRHGERRASEPANAQPPWEVGAQPTREADAKQRHRKNHHLRLDAVVKPRLRWPLPPGRGCTGIPRSTRRPEAGEATLFQSSGYIG